MTILSRKNNLGTALMNFRKQFPGEYEFFPITWSLPNDYQDLLAYHDCRQQGKAQTFIVKPEASCQGRGIYLTRNIESTTHPTQKSSMTVVWSNVICISPTSSTGSSLTCGSMCLWPASTRYASLSTKRD